MDVKGLSDVFVASGVDMVDEKTFTALFYGYEVRGKVIVPSLPTVEFFFYGNVYIDGPEQKDEFINDFEEKFGHAKFRFTDKFISILLDIGSLEAAQVKERLGAVGSFMISNGFGAIALQPEEPEPEPEPEPVEEKIQAKPQPKMQPVQQQRPVQQQQPKKQPQQPVYEEPKIPFEDYKVVEKLTEMFLLGINKVTENTFTTIYHGYNVVGKMLSPVKDDIEIIFYGELMNNVTDEFEKLKADLTEKYERFPIRMVGGSCDAILYLDGKDIGQCKEMLGEISGFMMKNNIVAINLPNTIGRPALTYTAESFKEIKSKKPGNTSSSYGSSVPSTFGASSPSPIAGSTYGSVSASQSAQTGDENSFAKKFLKKFSKKP